MIAIKGQTVFAAAARRARNAMVSEAHLSRFLPPGSQLTRVDEGNFDFTVVKDIGITTVKLDGTMTVTPTEDENAMRFLAKAKHVIGGSAVIDLVIRFEGSQTQCTMSYEGSVEAAGLVGKFLTMGESKFQGRLDQMFADFGHRLARGPREQAAE